MDFARHTNQGYNGRRSSNKSYGCKSDGCSDRTYADKRRFFLKNLCQGITKEVEREKSNNIIMSVGEE